MNEQNRLRLERMMARYARRVADRGAPDEAAFARAFEEFRSKVLAPQLDEIARELQNAGHQSRVVIDRAEERPSIELALGLRGAKASVNVVGFSVIHWPDNPPQILAYLETNPPPFDIERFGSTEEITPERLEQLLLDAVEHIIAVNSAS
jgi:hypothetical protein